MTAKDSWNLEDGSYQLSAISFQSSAVSMRSASVGRIVKSSVLTARPGRLPFGRRMPSLPYERQFF